jgi:hypothetical protein
MKEHELSEVGKRDIILRVAVIGAKCKMTLARAELQVPIDNNFLDKEWVAFRTEMVGLTMNGANKETIVEAIRIHLRKERILTLSLDEEGT